MKSPRGTSKPIPLAVITGVTRWAARIFLTLSNIVESMLLFRAWKLTLLSIYYARSLRKGKCLLRKVHRCAPLN